MAAHTQLSVEEYLRASFDGPDPDYAGGEIVERHLGGIPHSMAQGNLAGVLHGLAQKLSLHVCPELHLRLGPRRIRVADIAVFRGERPTEEIPSTPPFIAIEILSPDDRFAEVLAKFEDYRQWGVEHCWFVDPRNRKIYVYSAGLSEVPAFVIPELALEIPADEIFR